MHPGPMTNNIGHIEDRYFSIAFCNYICTTSTDNYHTFIGYLHVHIYFMTAIQHTNNVFFLFFLLKNKQNEYAEIDLIPHVTLELPFFVHVHVSLKTSWRQLNLSPLPN
jgi:hypothetical protein